MPYSYREVSDIYDDLHKAGVVSKPLTQWSDEMNRLTKSDLYSQGLHDNPIRRFSVGIDKLLEATGLPQAGETAGRAVGDLFGKGDVGAEAGRGIARGALDFAPLAIPIPGVNLALAGLMSGIHTYGDTGSPAAGVVSGITAAALPGVSDIGERIGAGALESLGLGKISQKIGGFGAGQLAALGTLGAGDVGQQMLDPEQSVHNPFSADMLLSTALQTLPFTALHAIDHVFRKNDNLDKVQQTLKEQKAKQESQTAPPITQDPSWTNPTPEQKLAIQEIDRILRETRTGIKEVRNKENLTDDDVKRIQSDMDRVADLQRQQWEQTGGQGTLDGELIGLTQLANDFATRRLLAHAAWEKENPTLAVQSDSNVIEELRQQWGGFRVAREALQKATTPEELTSAKQMFNQAQELAGVPVWDDARFEQERQKKEKLYGKTVTTRDAAVSRISAQERGAVTRAKLQSQRDSAKDFVVRAAEESHLADQQQIVDGFQAILSYAHSQSHGDELYDSGELFRLYKKWYDEGQKGDLEERVDNAVANIAKEGHEAKEAVRRREESRKLVESSVLNDMLNGMVPEVLSDPKARMLFKGTDEAFKLEQERFKAVHDTFGDLMFRLGEITGDEAEHFNKGLPEGVRFQFSDDVVDFGELPHVQRWREALRETAVNRARIAGAPERRSLVDVLRPAIKTDRGVIVGEKGSIHNDIIRQEVAKENTSVTEGERGFWDGQKFLSRDEASAALSIREPLHSEMLRDFQSRAKAPERYRAGSDFIYSLAPYDETTNVLNGKHKLPANATLRVAAFKNMAGVGGNPLTDDEINLYQTVVPGAFKEGDVNVRELVKGLKENVEVVETRKLGEGGQTPERRELNQLQHEFETHGILPTGIDDEGNVSGFDTQTRQSSPSQFTSKNPLWKKAKRYVELQQKAASWPSERNSSHWSFIAPKAKRDLPGYVELLVRVLLKKVEVKDDEAIDKWNATPKNKREEQLNLQYSGPHFGSEDTNVLVFVRGYEETLPQDLSFTVKGKDRLENWLLKQDGSFVSSNQDMVGNQFKGNFNAALKFLSESGATFEKQPEKAFHVIEVQSDWEKEVRKEKQDDADVTNQDLVPRDRDIINHPLLSVYETLGLKAAISHAREIGATKLIVSDAETAMMTEGHDKQVPRSEMTDEERKSWQPSQAGGMRLHYDTSLPSAATKLTGDKGQLWEGGVHKMAIDAPEAVGTRSLNERKVIGSPVFRDASGQPKTLITGRIYDLGQAHATADSQGGFSLTERARAPQREPSYVPRSDDEVKKIQNWGISQGGRGMMEFLTKGDFQSPLASDLLKRYPALLQRITAEVVESPGASIVQRMTDGSVHIMVADSLLREAPDVQQKELMHELVHGLTIHLSKDPQAAAKLEELRQRLIQALPKDERTAFDKATSSDWRQRYLEGSTDFAELHPNWDTATKLYGLLDVDELLAQGFTEPRMRQFMQEVKGTTKGNAWSAFTNFVKTLLGFGERIDDTAFGEFLQHSRQLMDHGEYLATFREFSESWFEGRGMDKETAFVQAQRAAGVVQTLANGGSAWDALAEGQSPSGRVQQAGVAMLKAWQGEDAGVTGSILSELGHATTPDGISDMLHEAVSEGKNISDALLLLPDAMSEYAHAKLEDYHDVMQAVAASTDKKNVGLVGLHDSQALARQVAPLMESLDRLRRDATQYDTYVNAVRGLDSVSPAGFAAKAPQRPRKDVANFMDSPTDALWKGFKNFFQQMGQLTKTNPETGEMITTGHRLQPLTRWSANKILEPFAIDIKDSSTGITEEGVEETGKLLGGKMGKAINGWIAINQHEGKNKVNQIVSVEHPEVAKLLSTLSSEDRSKVQTGLSRHSTSKILADDFALNTMSNTAAWDGTLVLSNGKKSSENFKLTAQLFRALTTTIKTPQDEMVVKTTIDNVLQQFPIEDASNLVRFMQSQVALYKRFQEHFADNKNWSTATRYGNFIVEYKDKGEWIKVGVEDDAEMKRLTKGKEVRSYQKNERNSDDFMPSIGQTGALYDALAEAQQTADEILRGKLSDEGFAEYKKYNAVTQVATLLQQEHGIPETSVLAGRPRQLTKLSPDHPWLENHFRWIQRTVNFWKKAEFRAQSRALLRDPELVAVPESQERMTQHVDNMLQPDPQWAQSLTRFASTWMLGFRASTAIVTASHFTIRHTAELTRLSGSPVESFRRVGTAISEILGNVTSGRNYATDERRWLMREADKYGEHDKGWFDDENARGENVALDFIARAKGEKPQSMGQRMERVGGVYSRVAMWMFQQARRFGEETAIYASFDYYKEQGLSREDARDKAFEFNRAVNPVGGRSQRPIGMFNAKQVPRSAAMLGYSLHSYVLGTIGQLGRYIMEGSPWAHEELTPAEKYKARVAAVQMLGMQAGAAGLLGLPFVSGALALVNQAFPQAQVNQKVRESVNDFFSGNQWLTDMAMTGLPSMLGWDLHSRLTMGNVVPGVNELDGFQPEALLGPPANLAMNFVRGGKRLATGDPAGALDLMPTAVKQALQLVQQHDAVRDFKGRMLFEPTPGEQVGMALGFKPTRQTDANTQGRLAEQSDHVANIQEGRWRQQQAQEVLKGNFGSVRENLRQRMTDPNFNVRSAVNDIARASEDLTFPRDLRRQGAPTSDRGQFLSTFAAPLTTSEVDRLKFRGAVSARLGLPLSVTPQEIRRAQLMDQLRATQPNATRRELQNLVEKMMSVGRGSPLLLGEPQGLEGTIQPGS